MRTEAMPWWKQAVFYEVNIRSFQDSNDDGVGDLNGITSRLSYLQDLGVNAIRITPFYPSPQIDFGYDVADHENVDPVFGTLADFDRLVAAAHRRDIRIVIDVILNHTSDQHPFFHASRASRSSAYRDWYIYRALLRLRGTNTALHQGRYRTLRSHPDVFRVRQTEQHARPCDRAQHGQRAAGGGT